MKRPSPPSRPQGAAAAPLCRFGDSLFGCRIGAGTPQVLGLHGWGRSHRDLLGCLDGTDAIVLDLPGFGASPPPTAPGGAAAYADLIEPILRECGSEVVVVGHSFGGRIAVELAVRRPAAVAALVLCGVPLLRGARGRPARTALRFRLARGLARRGLLSAEQMERLRRRSGSADYQAARGIMRQVLVTAVNETYESQLRGLAQPVELVWGRDDLTVPVEIARRAVSLLADARLSVLDGVGHLVPTEAPGALAQALARRLDERR